MAVSKIRSRWVEGLLEFFAVASGNKVLRITDTGIEANVTGNVTGTQKGAVTGSVVIEKADDYALAAADKANLFISIKATAASKVFTLGLAAGQIALVYNHGTNTFTVKNVADDTGTALETTKLALVVGSATANASTVIALN